MGRKFKVELCSDFDYLWRYNITLACEQLDSSGERIDFSSVERKVADIGTNLKAAPEGWQRGEKLSLTTSECDHISLIVYLLPHTLPPQKDVDSCAPFKLSIKVSAGREKVYDKVHYINQWGGDSIELKLPASK